MYTQTNRVSLFTKPVNTKSEEQVPEKYVSLFEAYSLIIGEGANNPIPALIRQLRAINNPDPEQAKEDSPTLCLEGSSRTGPSMD